MTFHGLSSTNTRVLHAIDVFLLVKWSAAFRATNGFRWLGSIAGEIPVSGFSSWKLNSSGNKIDEINILSIKIRNLPIALWTGVTSSSWTCCGQYDAYRCTSTVSSWPGLPLCSYSFLQEIRLNKSRTFCKREVCSSELRAWTRTMVVQ